MTPDPKAAAGAKKAPLHLLPPCFNQAVAEVLNVGARKYGAWNWRDEGAQYKASTYIGAIRRHLDAWMEGEDLDPEAGECHLAHIAASVAILLDAAHVGHFEDDRP